jgi:hypothetical protein
LKKIIHEYWKLRKDVKELSSIMGRNEVIKVMREYNLMIGGADID